MKKTIINKFIIYISVFILFFLFIKEIVEIKNVIFLFNISPSFTMIILGFTLIFIAPLMVGFILAVPFILFIKKEKLEKTLRHVSYLALSFLVLLFTYYLFKEYTNVLKNFYGFTDFAEFMYHFKYNKEALFWTEIIQFCIETITFFLFATKLCISFIVGFILHICLEIRKQDKKIKKESSKI